MKIGSGSNWLRSRGLPGSFRERSTFEFCSFLCCLSSLCFLCRKENVRQRPRPFELISRAFRTQLLPEGSARVRTERRSFVQGDSPNESSLSSFAFAEGQAGGYGPKMVHQRGRRKGSAVVQERRLTSLPSGVSFLFCLLCLSCPQACEDSQDCYRGEAEPAHLFRCLELVDIVRMSARCLRQLRFSQATQL